MGLTVFKAKCRKQGITRWPYRRVQVFLQQYKREGLIGREEEEMDGKLLPLGLMDRILEDLSAPPSKKRRLENGETEGADEASQERADCYVICKEGCSKNGRNAFSCRIFFYLLTHENQEQEQDSEFSEGEDASEDEEPEDSVRGAAEPQEV